MSYRRGYLSSTGGFADGFTSGFGLMNEAYSNKRRLDMAEDEMAYSRDKDRLDREQAQKNFNAEEAAAERRFNAQQTTANNQYALDEKRLGLAQTEAKGNADVRSKQLQTATDQSAAAKVALDATLKEQKNQEAIEAIAKLDLLVKRAKENGTQPDLTTVNNLMKLTQGTAYDLDIALGSDYQAGLATLTSTLSTQLNNGEFDGSNPELLRGLDAIINSQEGAMIGRVIDESFVNAPPEYRNGDFRVVSREAYNVNASEEAMEGQAGPPQLMVGAEVLVTAEDKDGNIVQYIAPMTDGRSGQTSESVKIPATTMFDGIAGSAVLVDYLNTSLADTVKRARIEELGGQAGFKESVSVETAAINQAMTEFPNLKTYLPNKMNGDLTPQDIARIAEDKTLGLGRKQSSFREDAARARVQTREAVKTELGTKYVREVNNENVPIKVEEFTDKELFQIYATLSESGGDLVITKKTRDLLKDLTEKRGGVYIDRGNVLTRGVEAAAEARSQAAQLGLPAGVI